MELVNRTGFHTAAFFQLDQSGLLDAIVSVRGTFDIVPGGRLAVSAEQEPFQWEDFFEGDPHTVPLTRPSDLTPFKPGTDITVLGDSICPDPAGAPGWPCGVTITNAAGVAIIDKTLRTTGPRWWRPRMRAHWRTLLGGQAEPVLQGWDLTAPEPARHVALDWRLARGGPMPDETPGSVHPDNPVGVGVVGRTGAVFDRACSAPQIEAPDAPIADWQADPVPAGLGPLSPTSRLRQRYAGTYDEAWLRDRHPLLPVDFDERFWQCAPPDQVAVPWLQGTERFRLLNLHRDHPELVGTLPGIMLGVAVESPAAAPERWPLNLDGVHFDLREGWDRVILTWRLRHPLPDALGARLILAERARIAMSAAA